MPIVVACPGCTTKLSAPDSAVGKQIRCPKCGTTAVVPALIAAEEVPVVEAVVVSPKPEPEPVRRGDDEADGERPRKKTRRSRADDEDNEDERPRKHARRRDADDDEEYDRPRRRRRRGPSGGVIAAAVAGGILLIGTLGACAYLLAGKGTPFAKRTPPPAGWVQYKYPEDGIAFHAPRAPVRTLSMSTAPKSGWGRGPFEPGNEMPDLESVAAYSAGAFNEPVHVEVIVFRFRSRVPATIRDQLRDRAAEELKGGQWRSVRWLGYGADEVATQTNKARAVCTDRAVVLASIGGPNGTRAGPGVEDGFFDNFELTK